MIFNSTFTRVITALICLFVISVLSHNLYAETLTKTSVFEIVRNAEKLGKVWNGDEIRRSILLFKEAALKWKKLGEFEYSAKCLRESSKLSLIISDHKSIRQDLNEALKLDKKANNIEGQVLSYSISAQYFERIDKPKKSSIQIEKALKLSKDSSDLAKAQALLVAGDFAYQNTSLEKANNLFEDGLSIARKLNDENLVALFLLKYGSFDATIGKKDSGIKKILRARKIWESSDNKRAVAITYNRIAFVYVITDDHQKAIENYNRVLDLVPEDVDFIEKGQALSGIGKFYLEYGQLDLAEINFKNSISEFKKAKSGIGQLFSKLHLAQTLYEKGLVAESKELHQAGLKESRKIENKLLENSYLQQSGIIAFNEGNYKLAIKKLKEAEEISESQGRELPAISNNLGLAFEKLGDFKKAENYFKDSLKSSLITLEYLVSAETLYNLARLRNKTGEYEKALKLSDESLKYTELLNSNVKNQNIRMSFMSNSYDRYEQNITLLMKLHELYPNDGYEVKALQATEKSRARLMRENLHLADEKIISNIDSQTVEKINSLNKNITDKKLELITTADISTKEDIEEIEIELTNLENELETLESNLRLNSSNYAEIRNHNEFDLKTFQDKILDEQTILLEFFFGKEKSYLWLISKNDLNVIPLPNKSSLDSKIENLLEYIKLGDELERVDIETHQEKSIKSEENYWKEAKELSSILFGKVSDQFSAKRILIVPDGKLNYFPVSALPHPNQSKNTPLLFSNEIVYQPSASMLYLLRSTKDKITPSKDFLVVFDPINSLDDERLLEKKNFFDNKQINEEKNYRNNVEKTNPFKNLPRLNASKEEAAAIFKIFDKNYSVALEGFEANRVNFIRQNLSKYKVLHFATHGISDEKFPDLSGILLSQYDQNNNPLNGMIWLKDILDLTIKADLVVLSACDTGIGENIRGEGIQSLTNGFLQTGAKSVISSHWKVDDEATAELMYNFYETLEDQDLTTSQALRKAKIKLFENENYQSPRFWASFTITGDFNVRPKLNKNNHTKTIFYILFFLFFIGGLFFAIKNSKKIKNYFTKN